MVGIVKVCLVTFALITQAATGIGSEDTAVTDKVALPDFDQWWDYDHPDQTRERFEGLKDQARDSGNKSYYLQLLTQIARTYGLEGNFAAAHQLLDTVKAELNRDLKLPKVRYLLERGRSFRSDNQPGKSAPLFHEAYDLAREIENDFLAIDAAHMIALIEKKTDEQLKWNHAAIELAEKSSDDRAHNWLGSLYNNMGWFLHNEGKYEKALSIFEKAVVFREAQGKEKETNIARWCVARTLRSLGRLEEALKIQLELLDTYAESGANDGYVFEELAEIYNAQGNDTPAKEYFAKAYETLSQDTWLVKNEKERLDRLARMGGLEDK